MSYSYFWKHFRFKYLSLLHIEQMHIDLIVMKRVIEQKQLIFVAKRKGHKFKAFMTDDMEIRNDCAKRYHT